MRITREQKIVGHPAIQVRNLLKKMHLESWTEDRIASYLTRPVPPKPTLVKNLCKAGYLAPVQADWAKLSERKWYKTTNEGLRLAGARATKPISREKAKDIVAKLMERVKELNSSSNDFMYGVASVTVFGSFLTDSPDLSDIDLSVKLYCKWGAPAITEFDEWVDRRCREAEYDGKVFRSYMDRLLWPQKETWKFLKAPYLSFVGGADSLDTPKVVLYKKEIPESWSVVES